MGLRSRTRITTATSGPGRGPHSDGRARHRRMYVRGRARQRYASAEELRRRAEVMFAERAGEWRESGAGPPEREGDDRYADWSNDSDVPRAGVAGGPEASRAGMAGGPETSRTGVAVGPEASDAGVAVGPEVRRADVPGASDVRRGDAVLGADVPDAGAVAGGGHGADSGADPRAGHAGVPYTGAGDWRARAGFALRERMPVWLQARCGLERRSVVALTVILVVAAGFAVQHFWAGRAQSVRAPEVVRAAAPYTEGQEGEEAAAGTSAAAAPGAVGTAAAEIVVDVGGKVREPGIHRLPAGSRVADALRAAGGVRPGTNTDGLNRARFLVDGEQVIVGGPAAVPGTAPGAGPGGAAAAGGAPAGPVSLNTATVEQLDTLPGVGPVLAQHIIDYRTRHGGFRSVDELREVNGIGDRRFADLQNLVRP